MTVNWQIIYTVAQKAGAKFPECVAAQAVLESGHFKHISGENNYFGIKGLPGTKVTTQEWANGKFITIQDTFKDFATVDECVQYLVDRWYKNYQGYQGVNRATSAEECARLLVAEGYATDPEYANKLIRIMKENHKPSNSTNTNIKDYFMVRAAEYFQGKPHQIQALKNLEDVLSPEVLEAFKSAYSPQQETSKFPLAVPYFYQRDSLKGHGERMCFSSAMAMALDYLDPDAIVGDDDWYLGEVLQHGDTVSSVAQVATAKSLGFTETEFHTDGCEQDLIDLLDEGIPVPIGILHKGPISSPTGGGHWITLIGYDGTNFWAHDPYGAMDLINGGYPKRNKTDGKAIKYNRKNLLKRWLINSSHDGWYVSVD